MTNAVSLAMYFGMFGSIFFLSQFLQNVLHNTPLQAGVKLLVWTGATMIVSPLAGFFSERYGPRLFMVTGLALQAIALGWLATEASVTQTYASMIGPFVLAGSGMALVFAPAANAVLSSVRVPKAGQASGATNAIRELGGVLGIAVLATVFTSHGSYASPQDYVAGLVPAIWVGAGVLGAGALIAAVLPFGRSRQATAEVQGAEARPPSCPRAPSSSSRRLSGRPKIGLELPMASTTNREAGSSARPGGRAPGRADRGGGPRVRPAGLHGTPVDRIARRVGVAQPYVFSLFPNKRELFIAAVERGFELIGGRSPAAAEEFDPERPPSRSIDMLMAMGQPTSRCSRPTTTT